MRWPSKLLGVAGAIVAGLSLGATALAQGTVQQSGPIVPFHNSAWYSNGVIGDGGTPFAPFTSSLGLFNGSTCPFGVSSQSGPGAASAPYSQFYVCQTDTLTTLNFRGVGQATPNIAFNIGGTLYPFPGPGLGSVTSVGLSGGTSGLTSTGGPVTGIGTFVLGGDLIIANGGTGCTTAACAINALLPTQLGNSGKVLGTNGTASAWVASNALPNQVGNSGKVLGTNGTVASWVTPNAGTVTSIIAGTGLTGGTITTSGTIAVDTGVIAALANSNTWPNPQTFSVPIVAPLFTSSVRGLVPPSGGGTANFLRADGAFAAPSSGGYATIYDVVATYGGNPTGSGDNTTPFNSALAACSATGGGIIWFQAGTFRFNSNIVDNVTGCSVLGVGRAATNLKFYTTSGIFLTMTAADSNVSQLKITNNGSVSSGYSLGVEGGDDYVDNVLILGGYGGLYISGGVETHYSNMELDSMNGNAAIRCDGAVGTVFAAHLNHIVLGALSTGTDGIQDGSSCFSINAIDVGVLAGNHCVDIQAGSQFFVAQNFACDHTQLGFVVEGGYAVTIASSYLGSSLAGDGLAFLSGFNGGATVTGTRIFGNAFNGISMFSGTDITITGNNIGANSSGDGIDVGGGLSNFTITGNRIGAIEGAPGNINGIQVQAGASNGYIIANNNLVGNTSGAVVDGGTGATKSVTGNIGP